MAELGLIATVRARLREYAEGGARRLETPAEHTARTRGAAA